MVVGPGAVVVAPVPFWWGWSWGYGYYPLYPVHPLPPGGAPPAEVSPVSLKVAASGASSGDGAAAGVSLFMDGRRAGMHASFDGFELSSAGVAATPALTLARASATFSVLSAAAFRVRLEAGGSALSIPSTGVFAGAPYAGTTAFGPELGVSGQLGLIGPIGVEAHARFTLYPVPVTDVRSALAFRAGPVAFTAGWRAIQVSGDGIDGPEGWFDGPELGVQARF
jgi:hypothetical protein